MVIKNKNINQNLTHVRLYRKSAKFNLQLNNELEEIIIGLLLGDLFKKKTKFQC